MPIPGVTVEDVDAYSDVSNGSTISVGSAASGGSGHMPRPPTAGSRRSKSVQGRRSRVAKSPYSGSQLKVSSKQQGPKPTARNMWITAVRNGTATLSTENSPMKTLAGPRSSYGKQSKTTGTRPRHLSDFVPIEDLKHKNHVRSASMSASEPQLGGGGPAYKPQEDYYDEVIELKKVINALKAENNIINTKLHRVEGENVLKDRKMEDLLNQRKQPEDMRRTLTDKKGDTSAIVNSLKQKLHATERTVKDKEAELSHLRKDMKMTNIEELQIQSETYYQEVQRLQLAILEMQQSQVNDYYGNTSSPRDSPSPKGPKGKPSTLTMKRLAEENDHLKAENRSLKKDLLTAIENSSNGDKKVPLKAEYADMNRGQLLAKIHELEERIQALDEKKTVPRKSSVHEDKGGDEKVRRKTVPKLTEVPGRIELRGSTSQKLAQLQEREAELLEDRQKQREVIERLKEDRAHYRSVADDLRLQLKSTQEELDRLKVEKGSVSERRRSSASLTSPRKLSLKETSLLNDNDEDLDRMLRDFQQQRAAKTLQRQWRGYQGRRQQMRQEEEDRQNQAAVTLQKNWRKHRDRTKATEAKVKEEAITEIQAALRGQAVRSKYVEQLDRELEMTDRDDAIIAIQSAMRAHLARKKHLEDPGVELESRDTRTRESSSHSLLGSEPDSDDGLVTRSTSGRRHPEPAISGPRRPSLTDPQESRDPVEPALAQTDTTERDLAQALDSSLIQQAVAHGKPHEQTRDKKFVLRESTGENDFAPAPLARDKDLAPKALPRGKVHPELARNEPRDTSGIAGDNTLVPKPAPCVKAHSRDQQLTLDQAHDPSSLALSESDSDDDAIVIGRSARTRTSKQSKEWTQLNSDETGESRQKKSAVNDDSSVTKKKKSAKEEFAKKKTKDVSDESSEAEGSRSRLISAPRFSNISEHSEDDEASPSIVKSNQNRLDKPLIESVRKETVQRPKRKTFEIVDSDDDDDDDDAVVSRPRRSLDTGEHQQRPSLSRSNRAVSPPRSSDDKIRIVEGRPGLSRSTRGISPAATSVSEDRVRSVESRPALLRASDNMVVKRDIEDFDHSRDEEQQRPGLSKSKRPMSGKRPSLSRTDNRDKETKSSRASGPARSNMPVGSEEDSDYDDVVVTGKKTKTAGGSGRAGDRPSLTRRSPASAIPASTQRETLSTGLDNFFSSTVPSKGSNSKKSSRKSPAQISESDDDDDDDDDIVVSSLSKSKSKQKETSKKDSRDSVADLWAISDKRSGSGQRKSSAKSSKQSQWNADFEFEKPPRRPESQLDELF